MCRRGNAIDLLIGHVFRDPSKQYEVILIVTRAFA